MSNNIVRDVSDYLKKLDSKMNSSKIKKAEKELNELYSEYEEALKNSAKNFDNTALSDETPKPIMEYNKGLLENKESNIEKNIKTFDLISAKISAKKEEIEELKKEQKTAFSEISKEYNALFERYSESLERIKELRLKINPTSSINEYGEVIVGGKFGQLNRFIAEEEKPIFENISFYDAEIAFHENIMREVYKKLQKLEEKMFPPLSLEEAQELMDIYSKISTASEEERQGVIRETIEKYKRKTGIMETKVLFDKAKKIVGFVEKTDEDPVIEPPKKEPKETKENNSTYPFTVAEYLKNNNGFEKIGNVVKRICAGGKALVEKLRSKNNDNLERKLQKDSVSSTKIVTEDGDVKQYSNDNVLTENSLNDVNLNNEEVNSENVVNEVQENNGEGIILASPDGSVVKQYDDNAEVTKVFAR